MLLAEQNYVVPEQELLAVIEALRTFRCYLGSNFTIATDDRANTFLETQKTLSRRQIRWSEELQRYHFDWIYRPGKQNVADPLSRNPLYKQSSTLAVMTRARNRALGRGEMPAPSSASEQDTDRHESDYSSRNALSTAEQQAPADTVESVADTAAGASTGEAPTPASGATTTDLDSRDLAVKLKQADQEDPTFSSDQTHSSMLLLDNFWWRGEQTAVP